MKSVLFKNSLSLNSSAFPKVLVILASYNGAEWLREQVESILSQEEVSISLLIGDDGSRDGTRDLISEQWGSDPRVSVRFWEKPSGSAGANFRRLYRIADTHGIDYVALADQDDVWHPEKMVRAIESLSKSRAHGYSCAVRSFWPDGREKSLAQNAVTRAADFLFEGGGQGCTFVVRADLFSKVSEFCIDKFELCEQFHYHDWLMYLLARSWGFSWYFDQQDWMRYRQHLGNEIGSRGSVAAMRRRIALIKNGWYRTQVTQAVAICQEVGAVRSAEEFAKLLTIKPELLRRVRTASFVLRNGRRKFSDRAVLGFSALAGWI